MAYIQIGSRALLAVVFAVSAMSKLRNRGAWYEFVIAVNRLHAVPARWSQRAAVAAVAAEVAIAVLVAHPATVRVGFALAVLVLAVFTTTILAALRRGVREPCRCFGTSTTPLGVRHVVRNILLVAVAMSGVAATSIPYVMATERGGVVLAVIPGIVAGALVVMFDDLVDLFAGPVSGRATRS